MLRGFERVKAGGIEVEEIIFIHLPGSDGVVDVGGT